MKPIPHTENAFVDASGAFFEGDQRLPLARQSSGTLTVRLHRFNRTLDCWAAELVLLAHNIKRPSPNHVVDYHDHDKSNLKLTNLYWRLNDFSTRAYRRSNYTGRR